MCTEKTESSAVLSRRPETKKEMADAIALQSYLVGLFKHLPTLNNATATVTFTVTNFVDILTTTNGQPKTQFSFDVTNSGGGRVTKYTPPLPVGSPPLLKVNNGYDQPSSPGVPLNFQYIVASGINGATFSPIGVDFVLRAGNQGSSAYSNFPPPMWVFSNLGLIFEDVYLSYLGQYDFYLIIRRQDGAIGIIDPCILHEN